MHSLNQMLITPKCALKKPNLQMPRGASLGPSAVAARSLPRCGCQRWVSLAWGRMVQLFCPRKVWGERSLVAVSESEDLGPKTGACMSGRAQRWPQPGHVGTEASPVCPASAPSLRPSKGVVSVDVRTGHAGEPGTFPTEPHPRGRPRCVRTRLPGASSQQTRDVPASQAAELGARTERAQAGPERRSRCPLK